MTASGQATVNYIYDDANRLIQITQDTSIVSFTYDGSGRRTSLTLPNGIIVEYSYDPASRLKELKYTKDLVELGNLLYLYDKAGNRKNVAGTFARTGLPEAVTSSSYNNANRQTAFGGKNMVFDKNGNLTSITETAGTTLYTWNSRNQLTAISGPGVNASFFYDGLGRREAKTINGSLTEFLYDGINPVQETAGATVLANTLPGLGLDEFVSRTDVVAGTTSHFLSDGLGSTLALADSTGVIQTEYTSEPFGKTTVTGTTDSNPFQYTGRDNDGTGLHYNRARYYNPGLQRFISEDPIEFASRDLNLYAYVMNNPCGYVDPLGLDKTKKCIGIARVLQGNPKTVGLQGAFPGVTVSANSAAIDPTQFFPAMTTPLAKAALAPYIGRISGRVRLGPSFKSITDVIGGASPIPGINVRDALKTINPGALIIELVNGPRDFGVAEIELSIPSELSCPAGTQ